MNEVAHPWVERTSSARETLDRHAPSQGSGSIVDDVDRALGYAVEDDLRLQRALTDLEPEQSRAELKAALRARPDPVAADTPSIVALRQRHEAIADLENRLDELRHQVDRLLIDLDTMVAQSVVTSVSAASSRDQLESQLQRVIDEAAALEAAHEEIAHL